MLTTAIFELVQRFYHATDIGNLADEIKAIVSDKVNYREAQS